MDYLTFEQRAAIYDLWNTGHSISAIACRLALNRSYVQEYVRYLNQGRAEAAITSA